MNRYVFLNLNTNHIFYESNELSDIVNFYHKTSRRKHSVLVILDRVTGELVRIKHPKVATDK